MSGDDRSRGDALVEVVAGVIRDASGRVLLARRTHGRDLAGLWEFPGGKREPGESPEGALVRELHEELGIQAEPGDAVITVPHRYPHKRLRLDVRRVDNWRGVPRGLDGQALAWVPLARLPSYDMPAADRPVVAALLQPDRYLVTPTPGKDGAGWLGSLAQALGSGVQRVQLRQGDPSFDPARWSALLREAVALCREHDTQVLLNGDIDQARALGIGVHLRAAQLAGLEQRPLEPGQLVAASCHDRGDLQRAEQLGCDFAVLGPVMPTASHPDAPAMGWDAFARLREHCVLPLYAIGGLGLDDLATARAHGAQGIAAIRGFWPLPAWPSP